MRDNRSIFFDKLITEVILRRGEEQTQNATNQIQSFFQLDDA